jgi:hypothetical protein
MNRHLTDALLATAITTIGGIALFAATAGSLVWLAAPAYAFMSPGLFVTFFLGLGSGAHGAVIHTDMAQYGLTFLVWWGIISLARARVAGAKTRGANPMS